MKKGILLFAVTSFIAMSQVTNASGWVSSGIGTEMMQQQRGIRYNLTGRISTIDNVKLVMNGKTGTLSYKMGGKRLVSKIVVDFKESNIDKYGTGVLVLNSYTPQGKLKGRFIGEADFAECGYLYSGQFVNVNGSSTDFIFTE